MAFDGLMARAVTTELRGRILQGKVEKVYQPEADVLVFTIHTKQGNVKLLISSGSSHARIHFVNEAPVNPPEPYAFCMLLRNERILLKVGCGITRDWTESPVSSVTVPIKIHTCGNADVRLLRRFREILFFFHNCNF